MVPETHSSMNSKSVKPRITRHPDGISAVDAEYVHPGHAAVHIIRHDGRGAFVDTGTNYSVPYLLAALEELGIARDAVDYVFLTHVHMDHAGGAGSLIQQLPNARVLVHPRGLPHMVDPSKVVAASQAVYGEEEFRRLYGDVLPVAPERIVSVPDGFRCELAGREFELIHTPGHALHHCAVVDLDLRIQSWNRAAERLFGFTATEAVGNPIDIIVAPDRRAEVREILDRKLQEEWRLRRTPATKEQ